MIILFPAGADSEGCLVDCVLGIDLGDETTFDFGIFKLPEADLSRSDRGKT
jgi:hypothetical protein